MLPAAVDPVTTTITISRPRAEVFEYLADIANHAEFTDHYLKEFRLTREDSYGVGAGARFRYARNRFGWCGVSLVEVDPPFRIVEKGTSGKFNRNRVMTVYTLTEAAGGQTKVELTTETVPALATDRMAEFGARGSLRRHNAKALRRLRSILETGEDRGKRATVAGG